VTHGDGIGGDVLELRRELMVSGNDFPKNLLQFRSYM
jgi:hypothetical protein